MKSIPGTNFSSPPLSAKRRTHGNPSEKSILYFISPPPPLLSFPPKKRRQVFQKHVPGEEFVNTLPPFCEPEGSPIPEEEQSCAWREEDTASSPGGGGASSSFRADSATPTPAAVSREATSCVEEVLAHGSSAYCASSKRRLEERQQ